MPSMYVLYIEDHVVGSCLELMRKICDPNSTSKPHVTVKGPLREYNRKSKLWENISIKNFELIEPGRFFSGENSKYSQNTVYLRCNFDKLGHLFYKPDYMVVTPHITIYDGDSRKFAQNLFSSIAQYDWHFKIFLPQQYNSKKGIYEDQKLSEIKLKQRNNNKIITPYSQEIKSLFYSLSGLNLTRDLVLSLSDDEKINIVIKIYKYLEKKLDRNILSYKNNKPKKPLILKSNPKKKQIQLDLFKEIQADTKNSKPRSLRNRLGQYPTPPELAFEIVKYLKKIIPKNFPKIRFGDPSLGTGTFFYALQQTFDDNRIKDSIGVEMDSEIAVSTDKRLSEFGLQVINDDFFNLKNLPKRNLIISNPPYIRHHYLDAKKKLELRGLINKQLGINVSGYSSLNVYFILQSHMWMEENAYSVWLVPSEFMEVNYGLALRKYLIERVSPIVVHRFDSLDVQFEGVMVTSAVIILKNKKPKNNHKITFSYGGSLINPKKSEQIPISELSEMSKWPKDFGQITLKEKSQYTLSDLFEIKRGIATGANDFFIITIEKASALKLPKKYLKPILPNAKKLLIDVIHKFHDGYPDTEPKLCVIDCDLPEFDVKKKYPKLWDYLLSGIKLNINERTLTKSRKPWYKQEVRKPSPYLCTYMGRNDGEKKPVRFILNYSDAIATNSYLLLYPKEKLAKLIENKPQLKLDIFYILKDISSETLLNSGRLYGKGLFKIEPNELKSLPADIFKKIL